RLGSIRIKPSLCWKAFSYWLLFTRVLLQKGHFQLRGRAEEPDCIAFRACIGSHVRQASRTEKVTARHVHTRLARSVKAFLHMVFAFEQVAFLQGRVCLPGGIRMA